MISGMSCSKPSQNTFELLVPEWDSQSAMRSRSSDGASAGIVEAYWFAWGKPKNERLFFESKSTARLDDQLHVHDMLRD